jgi:hypothetical protein
MDKCREVESQFKKVIGKCKKILCFFINAVFFRNSLLVYLFLLFLPTYENTHKNKLYCILFGHLIFSLFPRVKDLWKIVLIM